MQEDRGAWAEDAYDLNPGSQGSMFLVAILDRMATDLWRGMRLASATSSPSNFCEVSDATQ